LSFRSLGSRSLQFCGTVVLARTIPLGREQRRTREGLPELFGKTRVMLPDPTNNGA